MFQPMHTRKAIVSAQEVGLFNLRWPGSRLSSRRAYWFEFDADGNLVDTDVQEHSDGPEASAMADDCKAWIFDGKLAGWMIEKDHA